MIRESGLTIIELELELDPLEFRLSRQSGDLGHTPA